MFCQRLLSNFSDELPQLSDNAYEKKNLKIKKEDDLGKRKSEIVSRFFVYILMKLDVLPSKKIACNVASSYVCPMSDVDLEENVSESISTCEERFLLFLNKIFPEETSLISLFLPNCAFKFPEAFQKSEKINLPANMNTSLKISDSGLLACIYINNSVAVLKCTSSILSLNRIGAMPDLKLRSKFEITSNNDAIVSEPIALKIRTLKPLFKVSMIPYQDSIDHSLLELYFSKYVGQMFVSNIVYKNYEYALFISANIPCKIKSCKCIKSFVFRCYLVSLKELMCSLVEDYFDRTSLSNFLFGSIRLKCVLDLNCLLFSASDSHNILEDKCNINKISFRNGVEEFLYELDGDYEIYFSCVFS